MSWLFGGGSSSDSSSESSHSFETDSSSSSFNPGFSDSSFSSGSGSSDADNAQMTEMLQIEESKATFNSTVHKINSQCFEICMKSEKISDSLTSRNRQCISDCCDRYVDTSLYVTNRFAQLLQGKASR